MRAPSRRRCASASGSTTAKSSRSRPGRTDPRARCAAAWRWAAPRRALAGAVRAESPDLFLCGVQSSDAVQGATGTALAELLGLPRVAVVTKVEYDHGGRDATVHREVGGGLVGV